jgi:hexulose-6-phosphate isomerase
MKNKKLYFGNTNLGFMQGRLVNSPYGKIQCFPAKEWKSEFKLATKINLNLIEWTVNFANLGYNPVLYKNKLNEIIIQKKKNKIDIKSLTCDYFMEKPFFKSKKNKNLIINNLKKLIKNSEILNIKYFIIPLVDNASIKNKKHEDMIVNLFDKLLKFSFKKINILFESDYTPKNLDRFIRRFKSKRIGINYDCGNSASLGYNFDDEKIYFKYIKNVHIKDRVYKGETVRLGRGDANLFKILKYFKKKKYKGNFIFQTARSINEDHAKELLINKKYLLNLKI